MPTTADTPIAQLDTRHHIPYTYIHTLIVSAHTTHTPPSPAALHEWAWSNGWDKRKADGGGECGGVWWTTMDDHRFKDSITMAELLHVSAKLANVEPTADGRYLQRAQKIWEWVFSFDGGCPRWRADGD